MKRGGRIIPVNLTSGDDIRRMEKDSIREWITHAAVDHRVFDGRRVLDYGCGRQPYRQIIEASGGDYYGFDRPCFPGSTVAAEIGDDEHVFWGEQWGAIVCTQILQYVMLPADQVDMLHSLLEPGGALVLTWPTCWDEIEAEDLWRFTHQGGLKLLTDAGFDPILAQRRAEVSISGFRFFLGHAAIAWK